MIIDDHLVFVHIGILEHMTVKFDERSTAYNHITEELPIKNHTS